MTEKKQFKPDAVTGWVHETIPPDEPDCKYLERWRLNVGLPGKKAWFGIRLHHFFRSDEDHLHDHSFGFLTLVLRGSYDDVVECPWCTPEWDRERLYELWEDRTGHKGEWTTTAALCEPYVLRYGFEVCDRAVAGIAYDHYVAADGTPPYDSWELLFRSLEQFENYANRSPKNWTPARCGFCKGTGKIVGDHMTPGTIRYRPPLHKHRVVTDGCWTLVLSGPRVRDWGFWTPEGWLRQRAYFKKYGGSAACQDAEVRADA